MNPEVRKAADRLARINTDKVSYISEIYLFPNDEEIRIVEVSEEALPNDEELEPFYFSADPEGNIPFPMGIAMIRPSEKDRLRPPAGWGDWRDAIRIWPSNGAANGAA